LRESSAFDAELFGKHRFDAAFDGIEDNEELMAERARKESQIQLNKDEFEMEEVSHPQWNADTLRLFTVCSSSWEVACLMPRRCMPGKKDWFEKISITRPPNQTQNVSAPPLKADK
jgi:hypothetical protein